MPDPTNNIQDVKDVLACPRYYAGQYLLEDDFELEQQYHIDRQRRHDRLLHVFGIVDGLKVDWTNDAKTAVKVLPGTAIDVQGRQIVVIAEMTPSEVVSGQILCIEYNTKSGKVGGADDNNRINEEPSLTWKPTPPTNGSAIPLAKIDTAAKTLTFSDRIYSGVRLSSPGQTLALRYKGNGQVPAAGQSELAEFTGSLSISGKVGIGTPTPNARLEVAGEIKANSNDETLSAVVIKPTFNENGKTGVKKYGLIVGGAQDKTDQISLQLESGNSLNNYSSTQLTFGDNNGKYRHAIKSRHNGNDRTGNAIDFYVWKWLSATNKDDPNTIGSLHTMTLDGGNVGIGTTTPSAKLDMRGTSISISGTISISPETTVSTTSTFPDEVTGGYVLIATYPSGQTSKKELREVKSVSSDRKSLTIDPHFSFRSTLPPSTTFTLEAPLLRVQGEGRVWIGDGTSDINPRRVNAFISSQTSDAGIAIAQKNTGANEANVNVLLQASHIGGYIGTASNHPLILRTKDEDRVGIDKDGNLSVNNNIWLKGSVFIGTATTSVSRNNLTTVNGTNTKFSQELRVGDYITARSVTKVITAITSDTSLTVDSAFTEAFTNESFTFRRPFLDIGGAGDTVGQSSLQLRSGNASANYNSNQLTLGYNNTGQYRHAIKTRHNATARSGNAIDFYVWKWLSANDKDDPNTIGSLHTMTLDGGNVGIGTPTPNARLEVAGEIKANSNDETLSAVVIKPTFNENGKTGVKKYGLIVGGAQDKTDQISLQLESGNSLNNYSSTQLTFGDNSGKYRHAIKSRHNGNDRTGNAIDFYVWKWLSATNKDDPNTIGSLHTMTLNGGNVGIGTTTPVSKLTINNKVAHDNNFPTYGDAPLTIFEPTDNGGSTPAATRDILNLVREGVRDQAHSNKVSLAIGRYENSGLKSRTQLDIKLTDEGFNSHNTIMSLRSNGKVGIGTTNPSEKLEVNGTLKVTGTVHVAGGNLSVQGVTIGNFTIELRGNGLNDPPNEVKVNENPVLQLENPSRGLYTVILKPDGTVRSHNKHDVYRQEVASSTVWNNWASWVNSTAQEGDIVAVTSNDAISQVPTGGSAETLLQTYRSNAVSTIQSLSQVYNRISFALLFQVGYFSCIEKIKLAGGNPETIRSQIVTVASARLDVQGPITETMEMIDCQSKGDWGKKNHPVKLYFYDKLRGKPKGTMIKAITNYPDWANLLWTAWVDFNGKVRIIHSADARGLIADLDQ